MKYRSIAIVLFFAAALAGCKDEAYRGLSARDANEMFAILSTNGISASRDFQTDGTGRLFVDSGDLPRAIQILSAQGYPRESYRSLADVFPGDGLIVSPLEQRARLVYGLSQELSRTVSMIDGVIRARVHLVLPEVELRGAPGARPSASVAIHHRTGVDTGDMSAKVRTLVANGVPGLSVRDVSVATFAQDIRGAAMVQEQGLGQAFSPFRAASFAPSTILWLIAAFAALLAIYNLLRGGRERRAP